jgi:hypothetical protein
VSASRASLLRDLIFPRPERWADDPAARDDHDQRQRDVALDDDVPTRTKGDLR